MDIVDYYNWGFIGNGTNKSTPTKDIDWDQAFTTYRATRDAQFASIIELIYTCKAIYTSYNDYAEEGAQENYLLDIDEAGVQKFVEAINSLLDSYIVFYIQGWKFWNTFMIGENKRTGVADDIYPVTFPNITVENFLQYTAPLVINISIDFTDCQTLNEEIYKNYIESFSNYVYQTKVLLKVLLNIDFEETTI